MKLTSFISACAVLAADVYATALFNGEGIEALTSATWAQKIDGDKDNAWVVTFYADWCPYCKTFSEEYAAAVKDPKLADKTIKFGAVDVMANRDLVTKFAVKRSPTVKVFGADKAAPEDYLGARKAADLVTFLDEFAVKHNFIRKPEFPDATYIYNLDDIIQQIAAAHEARVAASNEKHEFDLVNLENGLGEKLSELDKEFTNRLQALKAERTNAFEEAYNNLDKEVDAARKAHATLLSELDNQVVELID